jgi:hypothetical protein
MKAIVRAAIGAGLVPLLLANGCASTSEVIATGPGTYMVTGKNTALGANTDNVMVALYKRANAFCAEKGLVMQEKKIDARAPGFARFPTGRLDFHCVK